MCCYSPFDAKAVNESRTPKVVRNRKGPRRVVQIRPVRIARYNNTTIALKIDLRPTIGDEDKPTKMPAAFLLSAYLSVQSSFDDEILR